MEYTPWILTLNGCTQCLIYVLFEIRMKLFFPIKYEREIIKLSDGGQLALDWQIDHEGGLPLRDSARPILACIPGLSGGNDNGYLYSMMRKATENGFKCVVVNFRGSSGVNLTSKRFYGSAAWKDYKEPVDYISLTYC
jgi:abhydrolase domain-containing protein 1/3